MKADRKKVVRLLKTARGQIDGVLKMIDEDQYCIDIVNQVMASDAILKKAAKEILRSHIEGCVSDTFDANDEKAKQDKIDELVNTFDRITK